MANLDELSVEARRNTRGRFEQWVKNSACQANTLSAVLNVKLSDVARSLGYEPEYGQSPFAITRGLQFEAMLFKDDAKVIREALLRKEVIEPDQSDFLDLRLTMNGGSRIKTTDQALEESKELLESLADITVDAPGIVAGLMLRIPKGVMLPEATLVIDAATIQFIEGRWEIQVGEVKVFPDRGGFTDPAEIATARAQAGVYQHALEITIESFHLEQPPRVSKKGFLVFTWPGSNSPAIRPNEDLTFQSRRAQIGFDQLDQVASELVHAQSKPLNEIDLKEWIAHSETEYKEVCWSFCDLAPRCHDLAIEEDRGILLGSEAAKVLGNVTVSRAIELLNGGTAESPVEEDLQKQLQAADWGQTE